VTGVMGFEHSQAVPPLDQSTVEVAKPAEKDGYNGGGGRMNRQSNGETAEWQKEAAAAFTTLVTSIGAVICFALLAGVGVGILIRW